VFHILGCHSRVKPNQKKFSKVLFELFAAVFNFKMSGDIFGQEDKMSFFSRRNKTSAQVNKNVY
jgi:hypothetical protein